MNSKKVMRWGWGEGRDLQYFDSLRVAGEAFQHFQVYLQVEKFCRFCSFSITKLPWRQRRPKSWRNIWALEKKSWVGAAQRYLEYRFAWQVHKTRIYPDDVCWETLARYTVAHRLKSLWNTYWTHRGSQSKGEVLIENESSRVKKKLLKFPGGRVRPWLFDQCVRKLAPCK